MPIRTARYVSCLGRWYLSCWVLLAVVLSFLTSCSSRDSTVTEPSTIESSTGESDEDSSPADEQPIGADLLGEAALVVAEDELRESGLEPGEQPARLDDAQFTYGYTHHRADGNRLASGRGNLPDAEIIDIDLRGVPVWLVSAPAVGEEDVGQSSVWTVVLEDGQIQSFLLEGDQLREIDGMAPMDQPNPPLLRVFEDGEEILRPSGDSLELSPPAVFGEQGNWVYIDPGGDLVFNRPSGVEYHRLPANALPDARILVDERDRLLLLAKPTSIYGHGVLGDVIEASAITMVETEPEPRFVLHIEISEPQVIEGTAPLWVDLDGDGLREIIVTVSSEEQGAQLVIYNEAGEQVAAGVPIGQGYRWRHQIAAAPFGPDGAWEVVDVLTPHIGGVVEFFRLEGDGLREVASLPGYTSHVIGSRNLDMALAGDFGGDARLELLLPNQERTELAAIQRTAEGAEVAWTLPLEGRLATNLSATTMPDGRLLLGAGLESGLLRIWR